MKFQINWCSLIYLIVLFASVVYGQRQAQCCEEYCYDLDSERPQSAHYSTKTAYQIAKGTEQGRQFYVPNCNPTKIWLFSRHGARLPGAESIQGLRKLQDLRNEVIDNYEKRRSKPDVGGLCEGDLDLLKGWRWDTNITEQFEENLTVQGWNDLKFLAIRYQRSFPNIMENIYDPQKFLFRHTKTQRTEASYKAFVEGLFGENAYQHIQVPSTQSNDSILKPYDNCPAWNEKNKQGSAPESELKKFENSPIFNQVVSDVSSRLGFKFPLKVQQILDIYDMCRYDQAWNLGHPSPWCVAFTPNQINVLEYREDLHYYFKSGYGSAINEKIECAAVADLLKHLERNEQPQVVGYFTHSSAIQLLLVALGVGKDRDELRADNYLAQSRRKWKSSELGPFSANLAAIKYDCPNDNDRAKVIFFLNEKPVDLDWCRVGLCSWADVKSHYEKFQNANCGQIFCGGSSASSMHISVISVIFPFAISYVIWMLFR